MRARIRKIGVWLEETHLEAGRPIDPPPRKAVASAVIENPFAGQFVEDLSDLMEIGADLGGLLGERAVAGFERFGGREEKSPEDLMPWKALGQKWHLARKGFTPGKKIAWETELRRALVDAVPHLASIDQVPANDWQPLGRGEMDAADFAPAVADHFLTNPIARASQLMAELSANAKARRQTPLAAE